MNTVTPSATGRRDDRDGTPYVVFERTFSAPIADADDHSQLWSWQIDLSEVGRVTTLRFAQEACDVTLAESVGPAGTTTSTGWWRPRRAAT